MAEIITNNVQKTPISELLLKASWLSVLLGIVMELLVLGIAAGFKNPVTVQGIGADLVQKVSWSTIVCLGLAIGSAATEMRHKFMGIAGFVAAPIAFHIAKILSESTSLALSLTLPSAIGLPSPILLTVVKGLQYAALGYILGKISMDKDQTVFKYLLAGLAVGVIFGGYLVYLTASVAITPLPLAGIVSKSANEILFPIGCSLIIFTAHKLGEKNV